MGPLDGPDPWATPAAPAPAPPAPPPEPDGTDIPGLLTLLDIQKKLLVAVARHETSVYDDDADAAYRARARKIRRGLAAHKLDDPFPWRDLRSWWNYCSKEYGSYWERQQHLDNVAYPVVDALEDRQDTGIVDWATDVPETWSVLELRITELKAEFAAATTLDGYQDVGRRAVEILIGAVNLVWDPSMVPDGEDPPKGSDAKAKFDLIVTKAAGGGSHEELRAVLRSAWRLSNATKHSGSANKLSAFASAQAAVLIARTLREIEDEVKDKRGR